MTVRITTRIAGERIVLQIAGRLESNDLPELEKELRLVDRQLELDLEELRSADNAGIERLRELLAGGAELRNASPYVQMLLDAD